MNDGGAAFKVSEDQERLQGRERSGIVGVHWILLALPVVFAVTYLVAWAFGFLGAWVSEAAEAIPVLLVLMIVLTITWVQTRDQPLLRRLLLHGVAPIVGSALWMLAFGWGLVSWTLVVPVLPFDEVMTFFGGWGYLLYGLWAIGSMLIAIALWPAKRAIPRSKDHVRLLGGAAVGIVTIGLIILATSLLPAEPPDGAIFTHVGTLEVMIAVVCLILCAKLVDQPTLRRISLGSMAGLVLLAPLLVFFFDPQDWLEYTYPITSPLTWGFFAAHAIVGATLIALTPRFEGEDIGRQRLRYVGGAALFLLAAVLLVAAGENAAGVAGRLLN